MAACDPSRRPRLAPFARVRADRVSGGWMLLFPERGLMLNASARAIVELCTGEHTVAGIVERLTRHHPGISPGVVERDVWAVLDVLDSRGLLRCDESSA